MARGKKRRRPEVLSRHGRYRFQTGMITASLLKRGLDMASAREIARAVRDEVAERSEITTLELEQVIGIELGTRGAVPEPLNPVSRRLPMVKTRSGVFPFSKGVIVRDLGTAGLPLDDATALVASVEAELKMPETGALTEADLRARVAQLLEREHGKDYARRYRLTDWVASSDRPLVVLIGGATGVGKSTLAMELAYRLGVVWVTSTDMIRETLRTALSSDLVPGLHDHSFRGIVLGGQVLSDPRERVLAGFRQQAAQVGVGVRAVIKRALRERAHIVIEGTHLTPPFEQYLPPDADCSLVPFVVALPDEQVHVERFPARAKRAPERAAQVYLDAFQAVRWIQDDLLRLAEESEAVVLTSLDRDWTLKAALDLVSHSISFGLDDGTRDENSPVSEGVAPQTPTLLLIVDGMADEPNEALGGLTPLAAADTPTLETLAAAGAQGQLWTAKDNGQPCNTDEGIMTILGARSESACLPRGAFEALGQGAPVPSQSIIFRGNLATMDPDGAIVDRRAERISTGNEELLSALRDVPLAGGLRGTVFAGHEHRVLVVLSGPGLSPAVADTDPGSPAEIQRLVPPVPTDDSPEAARTASALAELQAVARGVLGAHPLNRERVQAGHRPANAIITRGAARPVQRRQSRVIGAMVARCNTALGIARYLGMTTATSSKMSGNTHTELDAKFQAAGQLLEENELVVVHVKGADVAGHDRLPLEKRDFISRVDHALGAWLRDNPEISEDLRIIVTADHGTSSRTGNHLAEPVPLLLASWRSGQEERAKFDEQSAEHGVLGLLRSEDVADLLFGGGLS